MWRIPGSYCKKCMLEIGADFEKHGDVLLPKRGCDLCRVEYYFLKSYNKGSKHQNYCHVCYEVVSSGVVPADKKTVQPTQKLPLIMVVFGGLGIIMMAAGLVFTMMSTGENANIANILFGAITTALGFVLVRRMLKFRSALLGKNSSIQTGSQS